MITTITGRLVEKSPTELVVECNGLGYLINISLNTFSKLGNDENIRLYTYLQVKEDSHTLFGFFDKKERNLFKKLISVSGIGASTARTMLSSLTPEEIQNAIRLKTAQRVIIDLKDKVGILSEKNEINRNLYNTNHDEALSALEVLGYGRKQTSKIVQMLINEDPEISVEQLIKGALNKL